MKKLKSRHEKGRTYSKIKKYTKNKLRIGLYIGSIFALFVFAICMRNFKAADAAIEVSGGIEIPKYDPSFSLGTTEHPFVVLEVVPYEGFASFGYLIGGEEPVDLGISKYSDYAANILKSHDGLKVEDGLEERTFEPNEDMIAAYADPNNTAITVDSSATQYGYYQKVNDGSGTFNLDIKYEEIKKEEGSEEEEVKEEGMAEVKIATASFIEVATGGSYQWVGSKAEVTENPEETDYTAEKVYSTRMNTLYVAKTFNITNLELFKKKVLDLDDSKISDYQVKVITVTATQLNNNLGLIDRANLIYITDRLSDNDYAKLWASDIYRTKSRFDATIKYLSDFNVHRFTETDLSWKAVEKIFKKQAGSELESGVKNCPVIYDATCFSNQKSDDTRNVTVKKKVNEGTGAEVSSPKNTGYKNNIYKLGLLLRQMDSYQIYQLYFKSGIIKEDTLNQTGTFSSTLFGDSNAPIYWNDYTLYPYNKLKNKTNIASDFAHMRIRYQDTKVEFAHDNTYIYNNTHSLSMMFNTPTTAKDTYTDEVYNYYGKSISNFTPAQVIKYLLDRSDDGENRNEVSILEIQPDIMYNETPTEVKSIFQPVEYWEYYVHYLLPGFTGTVKVENQIVKEFNCRVQPLNATYDMIYLGINASSLKRYGDTSLNNLVYFNAGAKIEVYADEFQANVGNWIPGIGSGSFKTRLSGNDITKLKQEQLFNYAKAGFPIIIGKNIMNGSLINEDYIDRASYMYQLLNGLISEDEYKDSVIFEHKAIGYHISKQLNQNYCYIEKSLAPVAYRDLQSDSDKTSPIYINEESIDYKKLKYKIKIHEGVGINAKYRAYLCIDMNADGTYNRTTEIIQHMKIYDEAGKEYDRNLDLKAGKEYTILVDVGTHVGVITWELAVDRVSSSVSDHITGISAIKCESDAQKVKLKILQIVKDSPNDTTIPLPTDDEINRAKLSYGSSKSQATIIQAFVDKVKINGTSLPSNKAKVSGLFHYYTKDLDDYELSFSRARIIDVKNSVAADSNYLKKFDMLIIGFADGNWQINDQKTLDAIEEYIESGRTLLLTHDTTFFGSDHKFTQRFREMVGQDRYGVTMMASAADKKVEDRKNAGKDMVYTLRSDRVMSTEDDKLSHGFTDQLSLRYRSSGRTGDGWNDYMTTNVNQTNPGQITSYPYAIGSNIQTANTHSLFLALDLNQSDMVVWYTLSDQGKKTLEYNDGRNGYYIYNKGNITYSGAGHSCDNDPLKMIDEVKLFINTIIAAHRATPDLSLIQFENTDLTRYADNESIYVHYDSNESNPIAIGQDVNINEQTKRVYYKLIASGILENPEYVIKYYKVNVSTGAREEFSPGAVYKKAGGSTVTKLEANESYYINVPIDLLKTNNKMAIEFEITLKYGTERHTLFGKKSLFIVRRGLFNMD